MANKKAALKAVRQSQKRAASNGSFRSKLRTLAKKVKVAVSLGSSDLRSVVSSYVSELDKAVKKHVIHRNNANRHKSAVGRYLV